MFWSGAFSERNETMDKLQAAIDANAKPGEPRVTSAAIEDAIVSEHYFTAADGVRGEAPSFADVMTPPTTLEQVTYCVIVLRNKFTVTGQSAVLSAANFDAQIGRQLARRDAIRQVGPLLAYGEAERRRVHEAKMASGQLVGGTLASQPRVANVAGQCQQPPAAMPQMAQPVLPAQPMMLDPAQVSKAIPVMAPSMPQAPCGVLGGPPWDPARTVDVKVRLTATSDFATAVRSLKIGLRVTRASWLFPEHTWLVWSAGRGFAFYTRRSVPVTPWIPSMPDLEATDWVVLPANVI